LIGLTSRILNFLDIFEKLAIRSENVLLEKGLNDASLFLFEMLDVVGLGFHNCCYLYTYLKLSRKPPKI